jgi:small subunit ribosomal protein S7
MSRTGKYKKRPPQPDSIYNDLLVTRLINRVMKDGKKTIAQKQVYRAFDLIKDQAQKDPLKIFHQAIDNIKPTMEVRARRVGGAAYQIPMPVSGDRREALAIRWLIQFANARPNKQYHTFAEKLAAELNDAYNNEGLAIKKKTDTHRMAEANKAFAHFRW